MRRELRDLTTGQVVGALIIQDGQVEFDRYAAGVLRRLRARLGDREAADIVMAKGWSNGYLYFAEPTP